MIKLIVALAAIIAVYRFFSEIIADSQKKGPKKRKIVRGGKSFSVEGGLSDRMDDKERERVLLDERRAVSSEFALMMERRAVLTPDFLSRFAAEYMRSGTSLRFKDSDLLQGVEWESASAAYNLCLHLASQRYFARRDIKNALKAGASAIRLRIHRPCKDCPRTPKEESYKPSDDIPIYPCEDCRNEGRGLFFYCVEFAD